MSNKHERERFTKNSRIPTVPISPRKDQLVPTDTNLKRITDAIKNDLIRNGGDKRIQAIAPIGIAIGALGYCAGPTGTQELFDTPLGTHSFETYVASETIAYYGRNQDELKRSLRAGGVLSQQDEMNLNVNARMGNIQAVNYLILRKIGQAHEELLQHPNPRENLLVKTFSSLPQNIAGRVEEYAGQLVAMCYLDATKKRIKMLPSVDLTPQDIIKDMVLYRLHTSSNEPDKALTIPINTPRNLFVGGPGIATASTLTSFLRFPKSIYADRSKFVASFINSVATYNNRQVGQTTDTADVVTRSNGMEKAAEEFANQIDVAQFAMVHSAPREAVEQTLRVLGKEMKHGARVIILLPDKVYRFETSFQTFSGIAEAAGLIKTPFIIDGKQVDEYCYPHPNSTPGQEIYDRKAFISIFQKP